MFESARLKLTLFYLAILVGFSLLVTVCFRAIVGAEFSHANDVQRGAFHRIGQLYFGAQAPPDDSNLPQQPDRNFAQVQKAQASKTQQRLTREVVLLNVGVVIVGSMVSYWYAGRALKPIEQAHERQKRFTSDASHELRTPLASMRLENEIFLRQKKFNDPEVRSQIGSNLEEIARLERLTTNLLDLNRYETTTLKLEKLDIHGLVTDAISHTTKSELAQKIVFKNEVAPQMVMGDHESLMQLFGILLDNAVKYGPSDGVVELTGEDQNNTITVSVRDHGNGIAEADLPHIFERMFRGDKARSNAVSGHGIGLSLAEQIAMANGANVEASNHPEGGAVFRVKLPKV